MLIFSGSIQMSSSPEINLKRKCSLPQEHAYSAFLSLLLHLLHEYYRTFSISSARLKDSREYQNILSSPGILDNASNILIAQ